MFCKVRVRSVGYGFVEKKLHNCRVRVWKSYKTNRTVGYIMMYRTHRTPPGTGNTRVKKKV